MNKNILCARCYKPFTPFPGEFEIIKFVFDPNIFFVICKLCIIENPKFDFSAEMAKTVNKLRGQNL